MHAANGDCLPSLGFLPDVPRDRRDDVFLACNEHESNTCCQRRDTESILRRLVFYFTAEVVKSDVSFPPKNCPAFTSAALCAKCDARVGLGTMTRKNTPLLCRSFCEQWYKACENDYFAPAPSGSPLALTFCSPDSVICSPLRDVAADGAALCTKLGFEVAGFPTEGDGEERDEEEDATQCYDGVPAAALLGPGPKPARSEGAYGSGGRPTWREFLRWLELRLARCVETLLPRPEFWLFLFLCFYFLGKVLAALRSLVDRAAFAGRNPQWRSQASPASAWTPDREGERDEARDEARDESGGVGWPRRLSGAKETVPTLFLPREGGNQTEASRRACEAAEARRAHQIGAPGACRVRSGFRKPSSLFGTSDDEEEVMSPEAVREMVGGR